eukprot:3544795-Ditylum_brightwellii.AAC.1
MDVAIKEGGSTDKLVAYKGDKSEDKASEEFEVLQFNKDREYIMNRGTALIMVVVLPTPTTMGDTVEQQ